MLQATVIRLAPVDATADQVSSRQVQRWFKVTLQRTAPDLFAQLHPEEQTNQPRPYTVSPLLMSGEQAWVRLTSLDADLSAWHRETLPTLERLTFDERGDQLHFTPQAVLLGGERPPFALTPTFDDPAAWAGRTTPMALIQAMMAPVETPPLGFNLYFHTCTTFRRNLPGGDRIYEQLPIPAFIFQNLLRGWQVFTGAELVLHMSDFIEHYVNVSYHNTRTVRMRFAGGRQGNVPGFVGKVGLQVARRRALPREQKNDWRHYLDTVRLLGAFAFYSGVGYGTTRGLGQVLPYRRR